MTQVMCAMDEICDATGMECDQCTYPLVECVDTVRRECTPTGHWMEVDCNAPNPGVCNPQSLMCEPTP
jgi:hypothetical protein